MSLPFGHTLLPWPVSLLGADYGASTLARYVREYRAALDERHSLTPAQAAVESRVAALAAGLAALPQFSSSAPGGGAPALHICTVASRMEPGLELMLESARTFGLEVRVLGMGDPHLVAWGNGLGRKAVHVAEFVATLPPRDLVMLVDAYDAVFMARPSLAAYFRGLARALVREPSDPSQGAPPPPSALLPASTAAAAPAPLQGRRLPTLLFSAEKYCTGGEVGGPHPHHLRFPCLNSGGYLGPAEDIAALLRAVDWAQYHSDDQAGFHYVYGRSRARSDLPLVALDHDGEVFLTLLGVDTEGEVGREAAGAGVEAGAGAGVGGGGGGGHWFLKGSPPTAHAAVWHYPSYFKRMSIAVGLLTGRLGTGGVALARQAIGVAWGAMGAAFALGCCAGALCCAALPVAAGERKA